MVKSNASKEYQTSCDIITGGHAVNKRQPSYGAFSEGTGLNSIRDRVITFHKKGSQPNELDAVTIS